MPAQFRIGHHELCEPDYRQILRWAEALERPPLAVIQRLLAKPEPRLHIQWNENEFVGERGGGPVIHSKLMGGRLIQLSWNLAALPLERFELSDELQLEKLEIAGHDG